MGQLVRHGGHQRFGVLELGGRDPHHSRRRLPGRFGLRCISGNLTVETEAATRAGASANCPAAPGILVVVEDLKVDLLRPHPHVAADARHRGPEPPRASPRRHRESSAPPARRRPLSAAGRGRTRRPAIPCGPRPRPSRADPPAPPAQTSRKASSPPPKKLVVKNIAGLDPPIKTAYRRGSAPRPCAEVAAESLESAPLPATSGRRTKPTRPPADRRATSNGRDIPARHNSHRCR